MRKKICVLSFLLLGVFGLFFSANLNAQGIEKEQLDQMASEFGTMVSEYENEIDKLENQAGIIILLVVLVGALGITTGVLQSLRKKWSKKATVAAGMLISLLTLVNNTLFDTDHRELLSRANRARAIIGEIRFDIQKRIHVNLKNEDDVRTWMDGIQQKFREFNNSMTTPSNGNTNSLAKSPSPGMLYAQEHSPSWLKRLPQDQQFFYFVGKGTGRLLAEAKQKAHRDGIAKAARYFEGQFRKMQNNTASALKADSISKYLVKSALISGTHYERISNNSYRYYTLLKINRRVATTDLRFYSIKKMIPLSKKMKESVYQMKQKEKKLP